MLMLATMLWFAAGDPVVRGEARFEPTPAEAGVPAVFRLERARYPYEMELRRETSRYRVWAVRFPSPVVTVDEANNTVHTEYFEPSGSGPDSKRPAVVVLHILGADFALARYFAARLADRGVAALFLKLPYYGERRPAGKRFLSSDLTRTVSAMRQGVCDVRRAVAWLGGRPEVDSGKLGVTGISLGGIVSVLAASADPEIRMACPLLAGGGLAEILWEMPEGAAYRALWIASGRDKADLERLTRPYDPVTYAHRLHGKRVLLIAGNADEVVPPAATRALWEAAGRPPLLWYDCGHYSAVGYLLPGIRTAVEFLADGLPPARSH